MRTTFTRVLFTGSALLLLLGYPDRDCSAQIGGTPGAFSRLGFGPRGMGMGNAMTAVADGDLVGYYNPALLPSTAYRYAGATFGILSLDRSLNFLSYAQALPPTAGLSVSLINAGVSEIDGRDSDGRPTGPIRTSENQVALGFGIKFSPGFSLGLNVKMYYYHLYTDVTSLTAGLDFGFLYPVDRNLTVAVTVRDVQSKYKWDTSELLGQSGQTSEQVFPRLYTAGASYRLPDSLGLVAADFEFSSAETIILRFGLEVPIVPELTLRAGIDRIDLKESGNGVRPGGGFTLRKEIGSMTPSVTYAYVHEPFSPAGMHLVSIGVIF